MYLSLQSLQGMLLTPASENMLRWGLECTNSRIVLEGKEVVLILSLFKLFVMLWEEELFGKVMLLILLSVKRGGIKYHFKSLLYDGTKD